MEGKHTAYQDIELDPAEKKRREIEARLQQQGIITSS